MAEKLRDLPGTSGLGVEVQLTSKVPPAGALLRRLKRASVLRAPF
jgi:hypothetical protein